MSYVKEIQVLISGGIFLLELTTQSKERKIKEGNDFLEFYKLYKNVKHTKMTKTYGAILNSNFVSHLVSSRKRKPRATNGVRNKEWWENCYKKWSGKDFKKDLRVTRATFNLILHVTVPYIFK